LTERENDTNQQNQAARKLKPTICSVGSNDKDEQTCDKQGEGAGCDLLEVHACPLADWIATDTSA